MSDKRYWLMKSEPAELGIDDLALLPDRTTEWSGVRNYQARNFMRDEMRPGDGVFFYHSSCAVPGIAGICQVVGATHPDSSQFDPDSPYFDASSNREKPRWWCVDVKLVEKTRFVPLAEIRACPELESMRLLQRGNRLSITPVKEDEWHFICTHLLKTDGLR